MRLKLQEMILYSEKERSNEGVSAINVCGGSVFQVMGVNESTVVTLLPMLGRISDAPELFVTAFPALARKLRKASTFSLAHMPTLTS